MAEAYYYFAGQHPRSGNNKVKTDYTDNTAGSAARRRRSMRCRRTRCPEPSTAARPTTARSSTAAAARTSSSTSATAPRRTTTRTSLRPRTRHGTAVGRRRRHHHDPDLAQRLDESILADEWARFMEAEPVRHHHLHGRRQQGHHRPGAGLDGAAQEHGERQQGQVLRRQLRRRRRRDPRGAADASSPRSRRSTACSPRSACRSASTPRAPTSTRSTSACSARIRDAFPRWTGNLKQYKLGTRERPAETQDADSVSAINSSHRVHHRVRAQLLDANHGRHLLGVQGRRAACLAVREFQELELSGRQHRREGRAGLQVARADDRAHPFKTCARPASCTTLIDFNSTNVDRRPTLGAADDAERDELINWARWTGHRRRQTDEARTSTV